MTAVDLYLAEGWNVWQQCEPGLRELLFMADIDSVYTIIWQLVVGSQLPISSAVVLKETVKDLNPLQILGVPHFVVFRKHLKCPLHVVWPYILTCLTERRCLPPKIYWENEHALLCAWRGQQTQRICPGVGRCVSLCFRGGGGGVWPCVGMREGMLGGGEGFIYYVCPFKDSKPI